MVLTSQCPKKINEGSQVTFIFAEIRVENVDQTTLFGGKTESEHLNCQK